MSKIKALLFLNLVVCFGCHKDQGQVHVHSSSTPSVSQESLRDLPEIKLSSVQRSEIESELRQFEAELKKASLTKKLSAQGWQLHDSLLETYTRLKNTSEGALKIPAHSKIKTQSPSYCLNSGRAPPALREPYHWTRGSPKDIPYFKDVLRYSHAHPERHHEIQTLLWNLQNQTYFERYPTELQQILLEIDSNARTHLPSETGSKAWDFIKQQVLDQMPGSGGAKDLYQKIRGQFYNFKEFAQGVDRLRSSRPLISEGPLSIPETHLFAEIQSQGYSAQELEIYNPTEEDISFDPSDYFLTSDRDDVQRIGLESGGESDPALIDQLEKALYEDMARIGIGFTPVLNDVANLYELFAGKDFVSGKAITISDRLLSGLSVVASGGVNVRFAKRLLTAPEKYLARFEQGLSRTAERQLGQIDRTVSTRSFKSAEVNLPKIKKPPTLKKVFSEKGKNRAAFYVRPNGEIIPAKAYRYVRSEVPYLDGLMRTGKIPENPERTYISFHKYDSMQKAKSNLQTPHDSRYRVDFDTKQILDDVEVPRGKWGDADYLEPITRDYPQYGEGGATQAVTRRSIQADRIVDLRTGKVIFTK